MLLSLSELVVISGYRADYPEEATSFTDDPSRSLGRPKSLAQTTPVVRAYNLSRPLMNFIQKDNEDGYKR
jgi:hypothetical protein